VANQYGAMAPVAAKTAAPTASQSSRVIVKNLPKHATEERLREYFSAAGEVTDCRLRTTKEGRSRQFAFIGFRHEAGAVQAIAELNRSFFDTGRILVEPAHAPGSEALARPWSKFAPGSSAHQKRNPEHNKNQEPGVIKQSGVIKHSKSELQAAAMAKTPGARSVKLAAVKPTKAGVNESRVHTSFASSDDEEEVSAPKTKRTLSKKAKVARSKNIAAFDDDLDDLAYLKAKSTTAKKTATTVVANATDEGDGSGREECEAEKDDENEEDDEEEEEEDGKGETQVAQDKDAKMDEKANDAEKLRPNAEDDIDVVDEQEEREELESNGRLYVTNLPYGATEDELRSHFEPFGEVASVFICKDEDTSKSKGFGYVTFVFPECAIRAISKLNISSFQGRLLRIAAAHARPKPAIDVDVEKTHSGDAKSSYKRQREEKKKKVEAHLEQTWNLLYVSATSAADAVAAQLGVKKSELLGKDATNSAVTAALTETSVIQQTKAWLQKEGIRIDAFEQSGTSLAKSKNVGEADAKRRDDTIIIKHLPAGATKDELRERFARFGELVKCALAPSGTVAVVQYTDKTHAQRAFNKLAFSRFHRVPLYLEWAPECVYDSANAASSLAPGKKIEADGEDRDAADEDEAGGCLFVKNINFSTTEATLKSAFKGCKGFRTVIIMKKKAAVATAGVEKKGQDTLSMGYGFIELDSPANAAEALRRKQNVVIDGHALQLQVSQRRGGAQGKGATTESVKGKSAKLTSSSICVRNLAFEATRKELSQLFGAYGAITSVRIPKKSDYSGHRGFAFIDFASKSEAAAAYEALQHTHLYGRRLVIEPAEEKATDVGTVQATAEKRQANLGKSSEAKKRRRAGVLNVASDAAGGSFEDAFV